VAISLLIVAVVAVLALSGTPIFIIVAGISIYCFLNTGGGLPAIQTVIIEMNRLTGMPVLAALPLFTLAGSLLSHTDAPRRLMNLMQTMFGWLPGGVGVASLFSCVLFTALTGASGVTIVAVGGLLYPILLARGYTSRFSLGLLTTGGGLGLLFPPSLPVILYGVVAQVDISDIFKAALLPGILLVAVMSGYVVLQRQRERTPLETGRKGGPPDAVSARQVLMASMVEWPALVLVFVGIYGGFVTVTEAGVLLVVYLLAVECLFFREIDWRKDLPGIMVESAMLTGVIIVLLGFALSLTGYMVDEGVPAMVIEKISRLTSNRYVFLALLNLFLIFVGCIMDIFSAIMIVVPLIVPVALSYGVDPIHLCVIFLVNLEIGYATPPVGMNLLISSMKFQQPIGRIYRASLPFLLLLLGLLGLITYVPALSLFWFR
jgi:C4-dicarboxylate transporter, DctM subunit